jgi:uncharacterized protein YllA (UPF0747 family)
VTDVRIITEPLGGTALSRRLQSGAVPTGWLGEAPATVDAWRSRAMLRAAAADWTVMFAALAPALQATGVAAARLARVAAEGGVVVTTGQQPGLFGGPIYTWSKAVSALAFADSLERATGIPTAAVYWAATDDADFAEASTTVVSVPGGARMLHSREVPPPGTPMALTPLGTLDDALAGFRAACMSAADRRAVEAVLRAYGDRDRTVGDAFVMLLRELLAPLGMPVLDASHPAVHAASAPTLAHARERAAAIASAMAARSVAIRDAGFDPQVDDVGGLSLVFARDGSVRRRLSIADAAEAPGGAIFTPNVLLRPIVEQAILPTVAYVAGPGEIAYFAQVSAVADALGVPVPVVVPRWSCSLVEPQVDAMLAHYGATMDDLAAPDLLETRLARAAMHGASAEAFAAVQGAMQSLQHRIDRMERRLVAGIKRREEQRMHDVGTLRGALYPLGGRQERTLNLIPLLARHGSSLLTDMRDAARPHADRLVDARV